MASLSSDLVAKFAKAINNSRSKNKKEDFAYGTVVLNSKGKLCVKLDGSDAFTPISSVTDLLPGDRAMVLIKNHSVIVTGNVSSPAARTGDVKVIADRTSNSAIVNLIYPVGSIYMSVTEVSPEVIFGGKWEQIKDRFLLASGDNYELGTMGGEETHCLIPDEMPQHAHGIIKKSGEDEFNSDNYPSGAIKLLSSAIDDVEENPTIGSSGMTEYAGGSKPHNNMPPYLAVYMWKRIS